MAAKWWVNVIFGTLGFIFTFIFSMVNNIWLVSLVRAMIGFLIFFVLGYLLRLVIHQVTPNFIQNKIENEEIQPELEMDDTSFQAISLGTLHNSTDSAEAPEKMNAAIHSWTTQDQEG